MAWPALGEVAILRSAIESRPPLTPIRQIEPFSMDLPTRSNGGISFEAPLQKISGDEKLREMRSIGSVQDKHLADHNRDDLLCVGDTVELDSTVGKINRQVLRNE